MEKLLPIGSIVKLKTGDNLFMIDGYCQYISNDKDKIYDYSASPYPTGRNNQVILLNASDIDVVLFIGYQTKEGIEFRDELLSKRWETL